MAPIYYTIIGASLSKPHINSKAVHELYNIYYGTSVTYDGSMDISAKYSRAHSHVWAAATLISKLIYTRVVAMVKSSGCKHSISS